MSVCLLLRILCVNVANLVPLFEANGWLVELCAGNEGTLIAWHMQTHSLSNKFIDFLVQRPKGSRIHGRLLCVPLLLLLLLKYT